MEFSKHCLRLAAVGGDGLVVDLGQEGHQDDPDVMRASTRVNQAPGGASSLDLSLGPWAFACAAFNRRGVLWQRKIDAMQRVWIHLFVGTQCERMSLVWLPQLFRVYFRSAKEIIIDHGLMELLL